MATLLNLLHTSDIKFAMHGDMIMVLSKSKNFTVTHIHKSGATATVVEGKYDEGYMTPIAQRINFVEDAVGNLDSIKSEGILLPIVTTNCELLQSISDNFNLLVESNVFIKYEDGILAFQNSSGGGILCNGEVITSGVKIGNYTKSIIVDYILGLA